MVLVSVPFIIRNKSKEGFREQPRAVALRHEARHRRFYALIATAVIRIPAVVRAMKLPDRGLGTVTQGFTAAGLKSRKKADPR